MLAPACPPFAPPAPLAAPPRPPTGPPPPDDGPTAPLPATPAAAESLAPPSHPRATPASPTATSERSQAILYVVALAPVGGSLYFARDPKKELRSSALKQEFRVGGSGALDRRAGFSW